MKAALTLEPERIEVKEVETPSVSGGDVLLKTEFAAVCSTDVKIFTGKKKVDYLDFPVVLGHEFVGKVVETGKEHEKFNKGEYLVPYPLISCGECEQCLKGNQNLCTETSALGYNYDGGFAEYVRLPGQIFNNARSRVIKLPDEFALKKASLIEPVSCAFNGLKRSRVTEGNSVLVVGLGFMGLVMVQMARLFGATQVVGCDPIEGRRKKAKALNADSVLDPSEEGYEEKVLNLSSGKGFDAVIAALGSPPVFEDSLKYVKRGGTLNLFGGAPHDSQIEINPNNIHYGERDLVGTSAYQLNHSRDVLNIIESDQIQLNKLITNQFPLKDTEEALESVANNEDIKALISFE